MRKFLSENLKSLTKDMRRSLLFLATAKKKELHAPQGFVRGCNGAE
jgi:hypothetical protein